MAFQNRPDSPSIPDPALMGTPKNETRLVTYSDGAKFWYTVISISLCLLYIWMLSFTPLSIWADAAVDDGMFIKVASYFGSGHWLGPSDPFNQSKTPGYIFFLALGYWLGIPVSIMHGLMHVAGAMAISIFAFRMTRSPTLGILIVFVVLVIPMFYSSYGLRILRDVIYSHAVLLWLGLFGQALFCTSNRRAYIWLMSAAGGAFSFVWMLREEGVWLLPSLLILMSLYVFMPRATNAKTRTLRDKILPYVSTSVLPIFIVSCANYLSYGEFSLSGQKATDFVRAMNAIYSVDSGETPRNISVPRKTRNLIYAVSPAFKSLESSLDPGPVSAWQSGCQHYPETCGDIASGWFIWAMRTSVAQKGHFNNGKQGAFYRTLAAEIEAACASGRLTCRSSLFSFVPRLTYNKVAEWPEMFGRGLRFAHFTPADTNPTINTGTVELPFALHVLNRPLSVASGINVTISGWFNAEAEDWFDVWASTEADQTPINVRVARLPSLDLVSSFSNPHADRQRFEMTFTCMSVCNLNVTYGGGRILIPIKAKGENNSILRLPHKIGGVTMWFDSIGQDGRPFDDDVRIRAADHLRKGFGFLHATISYPLMLLGVLSFIWIGITAIRERALSAMSVFAAILLITALVRILVISAVAAFLFGRATSQLYAAPAAYLFPLAYLFAIWVVWDRLGGEAFARRALADLKVQVLRRQP